jgi:hypothetical protein
MWYLYINFIQPQRRMKFCPLGGTVEHHLKCNYPGSESQNPHFLSHMQNIDPIQIQAISHIHININRTCTQKWTG